MAIIKFCIKHIPTDWECHVKIDPDFVYTYGDNKQYITQQAIKDMVEFWTDWKFRLSMNDGDYIKTFAQQLGREVLSIIAKKPYNVKGVNKELNEKEGWCAMDGSRGITIISMGSFDFGHSEFDVEKIL